VRPDRELDQLEDTCALDVAERGPQSLAVISRALNVVEEQARVIVQAAQDRMRQEAYQLGEDDDES
jgi:hypothetical protein